MTRGRRSPACQQWSAARPSPRERASTADSAALAAWLLDARNHARPCHVLTGRPGAGPRAVAVAYAWSNGDLTVDASAIPERYRLRSIVDSNHGACVTVNDLTTDGRAWVTRALVAPVAAAVASTWPR